MARIPATEEMKEVHPGAAFSEILIDEENGTFEMFIYDKEGNQIVKHWGSTQRD